MRESTARPLLAIVVGFCFGPFPVLSSAVEAPPKLDVSDAGEKSGGNATKRELRTIAGWEVHVHPTVLSADPVAAGRALDLLKTQLEEIVRVVPAAAVAELRKVPLWISPEYPQVPPRAEYHPNVRWLRANGRDPAMAKGVEFTNVRIFVAETRRMPNFALHELAHAYHDRVLGFDEPRIAAAFASAKAGGKYENVERRDSEGRVRRDRAYAMTTRQEYFAESTEAYFTRNDFYPFTRDELKLHDPAMFELLTTIWNGTPTGPEEPIQTAAAIQQAPADFNHPPREYETAEIGEWPLLVEKQLASDAPELAKRAAARLEEKLAEAMAILPQAARPHFAKLKFFLLYGPESRHGGRDNGLEYFQKTAPAAYPHLDPRMARSIVVYSARNYTQLTDLWALKVVLHELAHVFHLEQWPENRRDIHAAWANAERLGLYRNVRDEGGRTLAKAYATQNHLEYFAELTCAYFARCDYEPFDRSQLKAYDPVGYGLIEKLWQPQPATSTSATD